MKKKLMNIMGSKVNYYNSSELNEVMRRIPEIKRKRNIPKKKYKEEVLMFDLPNWGLTKKER